MLSKSPDTMRGTGNRELNIRNYV